MLAETPLLRRAATCLLVAVLFATVAAGAGLLGDAVSAVVASTIFGF